MTRPDAPAEETLGRARAVLLDIDGVLTDGGLYYADDGRFLVRFDVRDGLGIARAVRAGLLVGVVSGRDTPQARRRLEELGVREIHMAVSGKADVVDDILRRHGIDPRLAAYVGDDIVDLEPMRRVGIPVAVPNADREVVRQAVYVTRRPGGHGAVREVLDLVLEGRAGRAHGPGREESS